MSTATAGPAPACCERRLVSQHWYDRADYRHHAAYRGMGRGAQASVDALHEQGLARLRISVAAQIGLAIEAEMRACDDAQLQIYSDSLDRALSLKEAFAPPLPGQAALSWRLVNGERSIPSLRPLVEQAELSALWRALLGPQARVLKSSYFHRGSELPLHADLHYAPIPDPSALLTFWIALEPCDADNGALQWVPRSHRMVRWMDFGQGHTLLPDTRPQGDAVRSYYRHLESELARLSLGPQTEPLEAGEVVLMHAALVHGGLPIRNPLRTRRSLALHVGCS